MSAQYRDLHRLDILEDAERDRVSDGPDRRPWPRQVVGMWVFRQYSNRYAPCVGGVGLHSDGAGSGTEAGLDRRYPSYDVGGRLAVVQGDAGAPAPRVHDGRHDAGAGQTRPLGNVRPGLDGAFHASPAPAVRPPVHPADDGDQEQYRLSGSRAGPSAVAMVSQTPAAAVAMAAYRRSADRLDKRLRSNTTTTHRLSGCFRGVPDGVSAVVTAGRGRVWVWVVNVLIPRT